MSALSRIEEKLKQSKENGNFYEAHQLYTTLYYRYNMKKQYAQARNLMKEGAEYLFKNDQPGSAADLCIHYVESLENHVDKKTDDIIATLGLMHGLMPGDMPEVEVFDKRALMWSSKCENGSKSGDKELRKLFALTYWKNKMYCESRRNFLYSEDGTLFGKMLQEMASECGLPGETDMFLAQAVLQLLCLRFYQQATDVFASYTELHPKVKTGPPFNYPLINFLHFLLIAVEKRQRIIFTILCEQYQITLKRDSLYIDYLERIAENYFGVQASKKKSSPGFLENLMQSLFDDEETNCEAANSRNKPVETRTMTEEDLD